MSHEHINCLLCESKKLKSLPLYHKTGLCKCRDCGFIFCKAKPSSSELRRHYENYGRNDYLSPITIKRYNELLDFFENFRNTNKILDVGCGVGYFLDVAKQRGWEVFGTEYTKKAVDICSKKGVEMRSGKLKRDDFDLNSFDIVASFEVIEHINDPVSELNIIHDILRPGGLFYVTTPNFNALERFFLRDSYNIITYPEHLSYYTPSTLNNLMSICHLDPVKIKTEGLSLTRIRTSIGLSNEQFVSNNSTDEILREKIEKGNILKLLKNILNHILNLTKLGNSIKGSYIKRDLGRTKF